MCAYQYGKINKTEKGAAYNYESASGLKWLVQMNWDPALQMCTMGDDPTHDRLHLSLPMFLMLSPAPLPARNTTGKSSSN